MPSSRGTSCLRRLVYEQYPRSGLLPPSEAKLISVGELMRVQGIPDGYQWPAGTTFVQAHNRIGNSVSPLLSYAIGGHIRSHVLGGVPVGAW